MKDKSVMSGVKILGDLKFVELTSALKGIWDVYRLMGDSYVFIGRLEKKAKQSHYSLYDDASRFLDL
jgi:hypothetical protein